MYSSASNFFSRTSPKLAKWDVSRCHWSSPPLYVLYNIIIYIYTYYLRMHGLFCTIKNSCHWYCGWLRYEACLLTRTTPPNRNFIPFEAKLYSKLIFGPRCWDCLDTKMQRKPSIHEHRPHRTYSSSCRHRFHSLPPQSSLVFANDMSGKCADQTTFLVGRQTPFRLPTHLRCTSNNRKSRFPTPRFFAFTSTADLWEKIGVECFD